jgi:predicted phosphodiesterase
MKTLVGVISDTHGLVRPEAKNALEGCHAILHAGDIGKPSVLEELGAIAPLTAIRGNVDKWATDMPDTEVIEIEGRYLYVLHDHSHRPDVREVDGVLYLNPGSAGPRRFRLPIALALLEISRDRLVPRIVELTTSSAA